MADWLASVARVSPGGRPPEYIVDTRVGVRDLVTGRLLLSVPACSQPYGESSLRDGARRIVIADGRSIAWVARNPGAAPENRYEVHKFDRGGAALIDSGPLSQERSLRLVGRRVTWVTSGQIRAYTLAAPASKR